MDSIDIIIEKLKFTCNTEISSYKTQIENLKEEVISLKDALKEKDMYCRHILSVLKNKNEEWKQIKLKLTQNKFVNSMEEGNDDSTQLPDKITTNDSINDKLNTCPNLDTPLNMSLNTSQKSTQSQSPPIPDETQSHLDTLISLVSSDSEITDIEETKTEITPITLLMSRPQKRKSHSRGCPCCDKFYQATRSPIKSDTPTLIDSFYVSSNTPPGFWDTSFTPRQ